MANFLLASCAKKIHGLNSSDSSSEAGRIGVESSKPTEILPRAKMPSDGR